MSDLRSPAAASPASPAPQAAGISRRRVLTRLTAFAAGLCLAVAPQIASAGLAPNYYVGTYQAGAARGGVTVQLVEVLPGGGYVGWITLDGVSYLGNFYPTDTSVDIQWHSPSESYQLPLGAIRGKISPDGTKITCSIHLGLCIGSCRLIAV